MAERIAVVLVFVLLLYAAAFRLFVRSGPPTTAYYPLGGKPSLVNQTVIFIPAKGFQRAFQTCLYYLFWPAGKLDSTLTGKLYFCAYEDPDAKHDAGSQNNRRDASLRDRANADGRTRLAESVREFLCFWSAWPSSKR
jgi:hypothetical protein